jgi:hypothetical protein
VLCFSVDWLLAGQPTESQKTWRTPPTLKPVPTLPR